MVCLATVSKTESSYMVFDKMVCKNKLFFPISSYSPSQKCFCDKMTLALLDAKSTKILYEGRKRPLAASIPNGVFENFIKNSWNT